jgi:hypothetical protein
MRERAGQNPTTTTPLILSLSKDESGEGKIKKRRDEKAAAGRAKQGPAKQGQAKQG